MDDGDIHNVAYVCLRDGSIHAQEKIHPTPNEAYWWNIKGGDSIDAIPTDCGPIGILIVGALADRVGASAAVTTTSIIGLVGLVAAAFHWPEIRRARDA